MDGLAAFSLKAVGRMIIGDIARQPARKGK
jgi:hypothetical protein